MKSAVSCRFVALTETAVVEPLAAKFCPGWIWSR